MTNLTPKIDSESIDPIQFSDGTTYRVKMPVDMTLEDLLLPTAWINAKRKYPQISTGNLIQCVKEDLSQFIELFVIDGSGDTLFVKPLRVVALEEVKEEKEDAPYKIKYLGPIKKHAVIRVSDGHELRSGISSKSAAGLWIRNNT